MPTTTDPRVNPWPARLKALRRARGLTQREAAALSSMSLRTWIAYENDQCRPGRNAVRVLNMLFPELIEMDIASQLQ